MFVVTDRIDRWIIAREAEELAFLHRKVEIMRDEIDAHPHTTRAELVSIAYALDEKYPTPLLNAISLNVN